MSRAGKEGEPLSEVQNGRLLTDRQRRSATIKDFIIHHPVEPFAIQPVPPRKRHQPYAFLASTLPYLKHLSNADIFLNNCEVVLVKDGDDAPRLAVQMSSRRATARAYFDPKKEAEIHNKLQRQSPTHYRKMLPDDAQAPQLIADYDKPFAGFLRVSEQLRYNEFFDFLSAVIEQSPSKVIRIENHRVHGISLKQRGQDGEDHEEQLDSRLYTCTPAEEDGRKVIQVVADTSWHDELDSPLSPNQKAQFVLKDDGADIPNRGHLKMYWDQMRVLLLGKKGKPVARRHNILVYDYGSKQYKIDGFGREVIDRGHGSVRIFDAADTRQTVKTEEEVRLKLLMTQNEVSKQEGEKRRTQQLWVNEILPATKPWTEGKVAEAAAYLKTYQVDPLELIGRKFAEGQRLVVLGMAMHSLRDDLVTRILQETPNLSFVAIDAREPQDKARALEEERRFAKINLGGGVVVEMSHEQAKEQYPDKYKDPDDPSHIFDSLIGRARLRDIDLVYAVSGDTWKQVNASIPERISAYMQEHPQAQGIYVTSLLRSIYWPGYGSKKDARRIGFNRPFVDAYSIANAHLSDTKVRMPAYELKRKFPGEVYNVGQFVMPRGFGGEWKNLRQTVAASDIDGRFSIDGIDKSPFNNQWNLLDYFGVMGSIEEVPEEELYQYVGAKKIDWGKLMDGVIIYPSTELEPPKPTSGDIFNAAATVIRDTLTRDN